MRPLALFVAVLPVLAWPAVIAESASGGDAPDAGLAVPAPQAPAAPAPEPPATFDLVQTPWGPGRKTSGEKFSSQALAPGEGPLRWRWGDYSLALGGQYFARGEWRGDADFDAARGDSSLGIDHRARLTMRASAKERVGVLLEFQDVRAWGTEPSTVGTVPTTSVHQAFVDVKAAPWLDVRVGRQELSYGEDRLIGNLDWAQAARAFNGVFARVTASKSVTLDAFGMLLKPPAWLTRDNSTERFHQSGSYFTGLYLRARLGAGGFDAYALGLLEDPSTSATGLRRDNNRVTLGGRGFVTLGGLALLGEGAFQTGTVGQAGDLLLAGACAGRATYTLRVWGAPYLLAEFSGASGDGNPGDGVDHTFHQLFPTGHLHLGFIDFVGWQNVLGWRGTVGWKPWGAHLWVDVHHFRAWDARGAWYAANGSVFLAADDTRTAADMGTEVDVNVTIPVHAHLALAGAFAVFVPGGMAASRGTAPSTWGFLYLRSQL